MKISLPSSLNPIDAIRRCGYGQVLDRRATEPSFARRLGTGLYPRFHAYINQIGAGYVVNLHLDQKQASYEGTAAHSGEYEGGAVEAEGRRIAECLQKAATEKSAPAVPEKEEKKGFFHRFF
ncbi:MAG: hypothetical protein WC668_01490 [Patescibacteria group bacterium]|jgi:hypothetical protein